MAWAHEDRAELAQRHVRRDLAHVTFAGALAAVLVACALPFLGRDSGASVSVSRFMSGWKRLDPTAYADMYRLLSPAAQRQTSQIDFAQRYRDIAQRMALRRLDVTLDSSAQSDADHASVVATVSYHTLYAGVFSKHVAVHTIRAGAAWRIDWGPELILPELAGGHRLRESHQLAHRGRILTRDGSELATTSDNGLEVGVIPGRIKDEQAMLQQLASLLRMPADGIKHRYQGGQPDWFMPVRLLPPDTPLDVHNSLSAIDGVEVRDATVRFYPQHSAAAHLVGYVSADGTPQAGLEKSLDNYIGGTAGGRLWVVDSNEKQTAVVAERKPKPGLDAVLAIDWKVQQAAENALAVDPRDAVVAEDARSGEILATASRPNFDPNDFAFGRDEVTGGYAADGSAPLIARASSGQYPSGSTFKPISAAAGLAAGVITPEEKIPCPHLWLGLGPPGQVNHETGDLGRIDLSTAIARSCNTYFYEVGKRLYDRNPEALPATARSFGLGQPTGAQFILEEPGSVPVPKVPGDATNLAIGQGGLQVTPLQMSNYAAALSDAGTVWRPRVVLRLQTPEGTTVKSFAASSAGHASVRPQDLQVILGAMRHVVADPIGTLYLGFRGTPVQFFGKSGTAETTSGAPDIWFIGGASLDSPTLVVAAVVEEKPNGLHSLDAASIGRHVIEASLQ